MKSYLLSSLVFKHSGATIEAFFQAFPHDWLLWEPGGWRAPGTSTVGFVGSTPTPPPPDGEALVFPLSLAFGQKELTLGRGPSADIVINDGTLSKKHLTIAIDARGSWLLRDAGSRNGTWIDGVKTQSGVPVGLTNGCRIKAAAVMLTYYSSSGLLNRLRGS